MKKIFIIPLLLFFINSYSQKIDTLISIKGKLLYDTALSIPSTYLITPTSTSLIFDSSKVIVSAEMNDSEDSIIFKGGGGNTIVKLPARSGSGDQWIKTGNDIYYNLGRASIGNTAPRSKFNIESNGLGGSAGGTSPKSQTYDTSGMTLENTTPAIGTLPQNSPPLTLSARAWNTSTGGHSDSLKFRWVVVPFNASTTQGVLKLQCAIGSDPYVDILSIGQNGVITSFASSSISSLTTNIFNNNTQLNANGSVYFNNGNNYLSKTLSFSSSTENYTLLSATGTILNNGGDKTWTGISISPTPSTGSSTVKWTAFTNNGGNNKFNYLSGTTNIGDTVSIPSNVIFRVASTTKTSHPFPNMTESQKNALTGMTPGDHIYQTNGAEGVYIYKSDSEWHLAY